MSVDFNYAAHAPTPEGARLLDEIHAALTRYVIFPTPEAADAVTLYAAATHAQAAWEHATRLVIKSPLKRCGKSRLQEVLAELCHRPLRTANCSTAALVRTLALSGLSDPPVLILDEADTVFKGAKAAKDGVAEDLRGVINAGHSRGWPYLRWNPSGGEHGKGELEECPTFAMAVLGGIGDLPDTIEDRAVIVAMRRRAPGERVDPFRRRSIPPLHDLRDRLNEWVADRLDDFAEAYPAMPVEDRAADTWEPLVAVADAAGGDWPDRARKACQAHTDAATGLDDGTAGERLLADLYDLWGDAPHYPTAYLRERLLKLEEAPWGDWYGRELTSRDLAKLLKPYGIKAKVIRTATGTPRGYTRSDLADAWARYTRPAATGATAQHSDETADLTSEDGCCGRVADGSTEGATRADLHEHANVADVADVALGCPEPAPCRGCNAPTSRTDPDDPDTPLCVSCGGITERRTA